MGPRLYVWNDVTIFMTLKIRQLFIHDSTNMKSPSLYPITRLQLGFKPMGSHHPFDTDENMIIFSAITVEQSDN